jgi:hypothetical protein
MAAAVVAVFMIVGCGDDNKSGGGPSAPATGAGITDADGNATFPVGSYSVEATVTDSAQTGLAGIELEGYLAHNNIVVAASHPQGAYYPTVVLTNLTTLAKPESRISNPDAPDEIAGTAVQATITMHEVGLGAYGFVPDPGFDVIVGDEWTVETWFNGPLSDAYQRFDTFEVYDYGFFIHLSQPVATALGTNVRTAVFLPDEFQDFATFSALVGSFFHLYEGDSIHYCQMSYAGEIIPVISVDAVIMHRDFWGQFTLMWGENPWDLDSHLWTPVIEGDSFHIYYPTNDRGDSTSAPYALLDVDKTSGWGPEHITIYENFSGTYVFAVHHYSGTGTIATAGASVSFLRPDGTVEAFSPPPAVPGLDVWWYWHVCEINGTTGAITPINIYSQYPPRDYVPMSAPKPLSKNAE